MNLHAEYEKHAHVGPGGMRCACCCDLTRRSKNRKCRRSTRYVHRKLRREGQVACEKGKEE